jgi:NAD(P)H-flavin reductase
VTPRRRDQSPDERAYVMGDIDVRAPAGSFPISRLAPERALRRVDRYDRRAEVTDYEVLTPTGTVRIAFRVIDDEPFVFEPGFFIGIRTELPDVGVRRSPYCIVSVPNEERTFRLLVRLVPEGPVSYYLGDLQVGDRINFRGPSGRSMVPGRSLVPNEGFDQMVFLATGVGVGPLMALVRYLRADGFDMPMTLYWGLRLEQDICLLDELEELTRIAPNFRYHISLSQPPPGWTGLRGRVTESVPPQLSSLERTQYHLVGNGAMIAEMSRVLSDFGVSHKFIHEEVYFNVRYRPDPHSLAEIRKRFVISDPFSPYAHQQAGGLLSPENPISKRRRGATTPEPTDD